MCSSSIPIAAATDRATDLGDLQQHDSDDQDDPADGGDDGRYGKQVADEDQVMPTKIIDCS